MAEIAFGQLVHAMAVDAGVEGERDQHRVVNRRHADAVAGKDAEVILDVLADLEDGGVFQHGLQRLDSFAHLHLARRVGAEHVAVAFRVRIDMREGDVAGLAGGESKGHADQSSAYGIQRVGFRVDGDPALRRGAGPPVFQRLEVPDADIGAAIDGGDFGSRHGGNGAFLLHLLAHPAGDRAELHQLEEVDQRFRIGILHGEVFERQRDGHIILQDDELFRHAHLIGKLDQRLAPFRLLDLAGTLQQRLDAAILADQLGGCLDAYPGGSRHVVDTVAGEGLDIDDLFRADAELLDHILAAEQLVLHWIEHQHLVGDELHQVLVRGDDGDACAFRLGLAGISGDQVVGFEALHLDRVGGEGERGLAHQRELRHEFFRRRRALRLVERVDLVAEAAAGGIEDAGEMGWAVLALQVFQQLEQHVAKAGHGADRQAVRGACQRGQGMEGAEDVGAGIDQIEMALRVDGSVGHGRFLCAGEGLAA